MKLNSKGFTLVELLAVIVIIAILGIIAIPGVMSNINDSRDASYNIMISNIVTASQSLYEEIEYNGSKLYKYDNNGKKEIIITKSSSKIEINLQTLVSNGFISGSNNDCTGDDCDNKNKKILLNPKTKKDIGYCKIIIYKNGNEYKVDNIDIDSTCPSEYKKEVKQ